MSQEVRRASITSSFSTVDFAYLEERDNSFLALFPHRFDFIWADHVEAGQPVEWKTESRYPLSDRLILQGSYLYGVRFGTETTYALLDIDRGSPYHPDHDPLAVPRMMAALEPLGLVSSVTCTSSYSGGLHVYFPFTQPQSSWKLAIAVVALLENAGFKLRPGHLEVFPNPKPYIVNGLPTLFNAHRLPLQAGSYLLNESFAPIWSTHQLFVQQWNFAQHRNQVNAVHLQRIIKQFRRRHFLISGKADKFINDLNAEIELGWTGFGQTNRLLGRITMREYIFHHVLVGGDPLVGSFLADRIVEVARSLPGYEEFCRHRHEIHQRATEWARCIEASHYFHYGDANGKFKAQQVGWTELQTAVEQAPSWNQQQICAAREKIRCAIADLLTQERLPVTATARFHSLVRYGIGGSTLYRHRDLWHPKYFSCAETCVETEISANTVSSPATSSAGEAFPEDKPDRAVENPPLPPTSLMTDSVDCFRASTELRHTSLFPAAGRNPAAGQASGSVNAGDEGATGRNFPHGAADRQGEVGDRSLPVRSSELRWIHKMKQFLDSEDPILIAEALLWAQRNPGILDSS